MSRRLDQRTAPALARLALAAVILLMAALLVARA